MNSGNTTADAQPWAKKRIFALNADQREAAQAWADFGDRTPSKPRLASAVVLLKDSPAGVKTFLTYRPLVSPMGIVAFPGGTVKLGDEDSAGWVGPSPEQWAKSLGLADVAVAKRHVVAAIRETFEVTGILLAGTDASNLVEEVSGPEWMKAREALAAQDCSLSELLERRGLSLRTDLLKPLSHWVSPDFMHRRYDTRYFTAAMPVNQQAQLLSSKGVWARWASAASILATRLTSALGDEIDQEATRGLTVSELMTPGAQIIMEKLGAARGCIAYLNHKRPTCEYKPVLVTAEDGSFQLEVDCAPASEGAASREL